MTEDKTVGMYFHSIFPVPGWGQRNMGFAGWKGCIDWARSIGINTAIFFLLPQHRLAHPEWSWIEEERMYHSLLATRPKFAPGDIYWQKDPLLSTPQVRRNAELRQQVVSYAAQTGMRTRLVLFANLGSPTFVQEHPEYHAIDSGDFCQEGLALSPRHPQAMEHLLEFWGSVVDAYPKVDSFQIWLSDPGGCRSREIQANPQIRIDMITQYYQLIRKRRPNAETVLSTWNVKNSELADLLGAIPKNVILTVPPGLHCCDNTPEEYAGRIKRIQNAGFRVEAWLETTENVTFLMPACYPERIEKYIDVLHKLRVHRISQTATIYPYVFTLNNLVAAQMACNPAGTAERITDDFLRRAFGETALPAAKEYVDSLEKVWTLMVGLHQAKAFPGRPWHTCFVTAMFPAELMNTKISEELAAEINKTTVAAELAVDAAERMAEFTWRYHALGTNILLISAKLLLYWSQFRKAQLPVFEAIYKGDLSAAVSAFMPLTELANLIVETAASAPNTQAVSDVWMKFHLLPERLEAVKLHLPELVERKSIRSLGWKL